MRKRPNVLVFLTDQQRADTIGALGNRTIRTPALDRLCREGTAFARACTSVPVCVPARVCMATGRPGHVVRCVDNQHGPLDAPSYMTALRKAGYQTHGIGKFHYMARWDLYRAFETLEPTSARGEGVADWPSVLGDYVGHVAAKGYPPGTPALGLRSEFYYIPQPSILRAEDHETSWIADRAIQFLRRRDRSRPFLLECHFDHPHPPFELPLPWLLLYRAAELTEPVCPENYRDYHARMNRVQNRYKWMDQALENDLLLRTIRAVYYGMISFIDHSVGRILKALGDELANTLVIFAADHGEMLGDYGCVGKRCMLGGAVRVPLIVRWAGRIAAGRVHRGAVSTMDLCPTILQAAGLEADAHREARSLLDSPADGRVVFSQFGRRWIGNYMASDGQWKYLYSAADNREWLFREQDALVEGDNLASAPAAREYLERLRSALLARHREDDWSGAVADGAWRRYEPPPLTLEEDPDHGLLFQDSRSLQKQIDGLGQYVRRVTGLQEADLIHQHMVPQEHHRAGGGRGAR